MKVVHHHLIKYSTPKKQVKSTEDIICFHMLKNNTTELFADARHAEGKNVLNLNLSPGDKAIVLAVELLYYTNDTHTRLEMTLDLKFDSLDPAPAPQGRGRWREHKHPDFTGLVKFVLEPGHKGPVNKNDCKLYEPNFVNLGFDVLHFAGQEESILNARSFAVATAETGSIQYDYEIFKRSDPFVVFILENRQHFKWMTTSDLLLCKDDLHYKVQKDAIRRVRDFFKDYVFPQIRYTRRPAFSLTWKPLSQHVINEDCDYEDHVNDGFSMVVMMLKVDYVVLKPDLAQFFYEQMEIK
ncbi:MAG: hypothetical protein K2Q45_00360 [Nitrosomonas sp.]|nr:hypothetical protein [Nitrosomonas sp.]